MIKVKEYVSGPGEYVDKEYSLDEIREIFNKGDLTYELADEVSRLSAENSRLEALVHRLQATSMGQAKAGEKLQDKLDEAEAVFEESDEDCADLEDENKRLTKEINRLQELAWKYKMERVSDLIILCIFMLKVCCEICHKMLFAYPLQHRIVVVSVGERVRQ